jgi:diguanylate cyclase (GGDEF)-like protein/putative nucleotidyltransferase with HDIG domain
MDTPNQASQASPFQSLRVLAIDDEPAIRDVYRIALTRRGCLVDTAGSGREALRMMMLSNYDVLIVDVLMSDMDGIALLQEALKIWPWVGVVIASGHVSTAVAAAARELGVRNVLHKPISQRDLFAAVAAAAATAAGARSDIPRTSALDLMRAHLRLLSGFDVGNLGSQSLFGALMDFAENLARMLPCDVIGILVCDAEERILLLRLQAGVAESFVDAVQAEMLARYAALNGREAPREDLRMHREGESPRADGAQRPGFTLSVPVLLGDEVSGVITLATADAKPYTATDVSLLYHGANHMATMFAALRAMHRLATRDPVTGLFNRIRLGEEIESQWLLTQRYATPLTVLVVDLDHFKTLNDTYGHTTGDEILRGFCDVLRQAARGTDFLARYGGDEFVVLLPRTDGVHALVLAERLLQRTRERVFCPETLRLSITISIGVASSDNPSRPTSASDLLSQADRALYLAKRGGRNRVSVWPGDEKAADSAAAAGAPATITPEAKARPQILVVDDEAPILRFLSEALRREGCDTKAVGSAEEAIAAVRERPFFYDLLITDISMPGMTGIELLREVNNADDLLVKVVMTGYATVDNAISCLREGAYDFISKPLDARHLGLVLRRALEYRSLRLQSVRHQQELERMVAQRSAQLSRSLQEVQEFYEFTLEAFLAMLDARERQTGRHSSRVRHLALVLARQMGLRGEDLDAIRTGALLHDIGKIAIPDKVLFHGGPLSPEEWTIMRTHPEIGYRVLQRSPQLQRAARIVLEHHEQYDGSGYPRKLAGNEICIGARIFCLVDAFDAMRSNRLYREALSAEQADKEILRNSGRQFDPDVVRAFFACRAECEAVLQRHMREDEPAALDVPAAADGHDASAPQPTGVATDAARA